jgi:VWFA-related protein
MLVFCSSASFLCAQTSTPEESTAQSAAAPATYDQHRAVSATDSSGLIRLNVMVTGPSGKPAARLDLKDFTLLDNDRPQPVVSFQAFDGTLTKPVSPTEVVLLIDMIGIPPQQVADEDQQVWTFLRQNGGHLTRPVSIFRLSDTGLWMLAEPSTDGNALAAALIGKNEPRLIRDAHHDKSMDQPSLLALKGLGALATMERRKPGRKLVIWIGPGWGIGSATRLEGAMDGQHLFDAIVWFSTLLQEADITFYSVSKGESDYRALYDSGSLKGVKSVKQANVRNLDRNVLAVESGGRVLGRDSDASNQMTTPDLAVQIDDCVKDADIFYTLSFDPAATDHLQEYHDLKVLVGKPGLVARTNTGYYDQPYYTDHSHHAAKLVTVEQLKQSLNSYSGRSGEELVDQLNSLELTERLSGQELLSLMAGLHNSKAQQKLVILADASAFLNPPTADVIGDAPPDNQAQNRMISLTVDYLNKILPKLPNFFATRVTKRYEETPEQPAPRDTQLTPSKYEPMGQGGIIYSAMQPSIYHTGDVFGVAYQPLHLVDSTSDTVLYRDNDEVIDPKAVKANKANKKYRYLIAHGTFGPILSMVIVDAIAVRNALTWSRWEHSAGKTEAVFSYTVPAERSHYQVDYCCRLDGNQTDVLDKRTGYHGEIAIDPTSGAILHLTVEADLKPFLPMVRSDTMVDYGSVEIGGVAYICPLRSVTLVRQRTFKTLREWDDSFETFGPFISIVNDVTFKDYHVFRPEVRILSDVNPGPE